MAEKKNYLTREGLRKYEEELHELKSVRRKEISQKIKEAREQGDLSENAEYDAARDEQRDVEARIEELENILKNVEVVDLDQKSGKIKSVSFGCKVRVLDMEMDEELEYTIKGASEANVLSGSISNESPMGKALLGSKKGDVVEVEAPAGMLKFKVLEISMEN
ncbi:MAG: transcription elongation factor GreA [Lachnospiraceae bacterium]|nr:transcription elongation factor GreA [Lachnospiraceae bacterium]MCR4641567.1 transcription elongation factor GreA [Lachnospiraceae bacterium]